LPLLLLPTTGVGIRDDLVGAVVNLVAGTPSQSDLGSLQNYLQKSDLPQTRLLRQPEILRALLDALFTPGSVGSSSPEARESLSVVIARLCALTNDRSEIEGSLKTAAEVCSNNPPGVPRSQLQKRVIGPLEKEIVHASVAGGVLLWIQHSLCENPKPIELKVVVPYYLYLSSKIAELHPALREDALEITGRAFEWNAPADVDELTILDIRKIYVEHLIDLSQKGIAFSVLQVVRRWSHSSDASLIRTFVRQMLAVVGPPFSKQFAESFLDFVSTGEICHAFKYDRDGRDLLRRFAGECDDAGILVPDVVQEVIAIA